MGGGDGRDTTAEVVVGVGGLAVVEEEREAAALGAVGQQHATCAGGGDVDLRGDGVGVVFEGGVSET